MPCFQFWLPEVETNLKSIHLSMSVASVADTIFPPSHFEKGSHVTQAHIQLHRNKAVLAFVSWSSYLHSQTLRFQECPTNMSGFVTAFLTRDPSQVCGATSPLQQKVLEATAKTASVGVPSIPCRPYCETVMLKKGGAGLPA